MKRGEKEEFVHRKQIAMLRNRDSHKQEEAT